MMKNMIFLQKRTTLTIILLLFSGQQSFGATHQYYGQYQQMGASQYPAQPAYGYQQPQQQQYFQPLYPQQPVYAQPQLLPQLPRYSPFSSFNVSDPSHISAWNGYINTLNLGQINLLKTTLEQCIANSNTQGISPHLVPTLSEVLARDLIVYLTSILLQAPAAFPSFPQPMHPPYYTPTTMPAQQSFQQQQQQPAGADRPYQGPWSTSKLSPNVSAVDGTMSPNPLWDLQQPTINFYDRTTTDMNPARAPRTNNYYEFTNFWMEPIVVTIPAKHRMDPIDQDLTFKTSEHYFQAMKFYESISPTDSDDINEKRRKAFSDVLNSSTPREAFDTAKNITNGPLVNTQIWQNQNKSVEVMRDILREKFGKNPTLKNILLSTGKQPLVEASPVDFFWGIGATSGDGRGKNLLGRLLMEVRAELAAQP